MVKRDLKEAKRLSLQFLLEAYLLTENNWEAGITFREVFDLLGWEHDDFSSIENFLRIRDYIERDTGDGGINGIFHLTPNGINEIEGMIKEGIIANEATITYDENPHKKRPVDYQEKMQIRQRHRQEFLECLYEESEGDPFNLVSITTIIEEMNLEEKEAMGIVEYLEAENLLERARNGVGNASVKLTELGAMEIQSSLLSFESSAENGKTKRTRGPNAETLRKLNNLRKNRLKSIRNGEVTLGWTQGCGDVGIDTKTAIKNAPELRVRWYDPEYPEDP